MGSPRHVLYKMGYTQMVFETMVTPPKKYCNGLNWVLAQNSYAEASIPNAVILAYSNLGK